MATPTQAAPKTIQTYAYDVCEKLKTTSETIKEARDKIFQNRPMIEKVKYYACMAFAVGGLILTPTFIALAAINFSAVWLVGAVAAAGVLVLFANLRGRFNSISTAEETLVAKCGNPLGLVGYKDNVPDASALKAHREFFSKLVAPLNSEKEIENQKKEFEVASKFFDSKMKAPELKGRFTTVVVTSLLLESVQHTFHSKKEQAQAKDTAALAEKLIDQTDFEDELKNRIKPLILQLKDQTDAFVQQLIPAITQEAGKAKFKLGDLDTLANIAKNLPAPAPAPTAAPTPAPATGAAPVPAPTPAPVPAPTPASVPATGAAPAPAPVATTVI